MVLANRSTLIGTAAAHGVLVPVGAGEGDIVEAPRMLAFGPSTAKTIRREREEQVIADRIRQGTTLSPYPLVQIETLGPPRQGITLAEPVAHGELGFRFACPRAGKQRPKLRR